MNIESTFRFWFCLLAFLCVQSALGVTVELKNIYAEIESVPSGAGEVYISMRPDHSSYMKESTGWGSVSSFKGTVERNGDDADGATLYEAVVQSRAAEGYEFVCYSYESDEPGDIFLAADVVKEASSFDSGTRRWSYATLPMGVNSTGAIINVTTPLRNDGTTDSPGKDRLFGEGTWSDTPDRRIYAIFRPVGDAYPMLDELLPVETITAENKPQSYRAYSITGQSVDESYKGMVIINGKKYLRK